MEEKVKTRLFNIVLIVSTILPLLVLGFVGSNVASADGPDKGKNGVSSRVTYPTVRVDCGQFRPKGYANNVRVNTSSPVSVSGAFDWSTIYGRDGLPISRSQAFPLTVISVPGRNLVREVTPDYLQRVQIQVRPSGFDIEERCGAPGITATLSFLNGQPWLNVTTNKILYTEKGGPVRFKRFNLSEQSEITLYMPNGTEGFYANFKWVSTIQ